jgi:hypothetical protein
MRLRIFDYVAFVVSLSVVAVVGVYAYGGSNGASQVSVQTDEGEFLYPLDQDRTVDVSGPLGTTVIEIHDGAVHVHDSPCRDKICVAAGWLDRSGEWAACLPNRVFIRVEGDSEEEAIDALAY